MKIIKFSINRPVTVLMIYLLIIITGVISFFRLPIDFFPKIGYPKITIITLCPNSSPEEIENTVSRPIEEVVSTVKGVRKVTSVSRKNVSVTTLMFNWGTDMNYVSLSLREKLDNIRYMLPENADRPNIIHLDPSEDPIMYLALTSNKNDLNQIQSLAEDFIKKRLQQLEGVASADLIGDREREIKIIPDMQKLNALNINLLKFKDLIYYSNYSISGGMIKEGQYRFSLKISGEYENLDDIKKTLIKKTKDGRNIYLGDIAKVKYDFKEQNNLTRLNRQPSLGILIRKDASGNTVKVCSVVRTELKNLKKEYPDIDFDIVIDQSEFIKESIYSVLEAIFIGGFLAFAVLLLFLSDLKSPINISIVMPVSILITFIFLYFDKISLNIISLSGLALGIGMLVDNSIVVSENIFRHKSMGKSSKAASYDGTKEVGMAITASTLTTLAVFLPIIYTKGIASALFKQQALTVTFSLLASLFVSLTLLPFLNSLSIKKNDKKKKNNFLKLSLSIIFFPISAIIFILKIFYKMFAAFVEIVSSAFAKQFDKFSESYLKLLNNSLKNKKITLFIFFLLFIFSLIMLKSLDKQFFPTIEQNKFTIKIKAEPGTPLEKTDQMIKIIETYLKKDKRVKKYFSSVGKSTEDRLSYYLEKASKENLGEIKVITKPKVKTEEMIAFYSKLLKDIPATITIDAGSNLFSSFFNFEETGLIITLEGSDEKKMREKGLLIKKILSDQDIFKNVHTDFESLLPEIKLKINRDKVALYNISIDDVAQYIKANISGLKMSNFHKFDKTIDITLQTVTKPDLNKLLDTEMVINNQKIPLRSVVDVSFKKTPEEIKRINQNRRFSIYFSYKGKLRDVLEKLERIIPKSDKDIRIAIRGVNSEIDNSLKSLIYALIFAVLLVYMILASQFESLKLPFIVMFVVPMGIIGVGFGMYFTRTPISIMSTLGMIILSGIIVNDAILLVDFINRLRKEGMDINDAVVQAAKTRLRPILMTTFTTVFGLLPLALGIGSGAELQSPMAISVISGILASTFLTLIFTPVLYVIFERKNKGGDLK